MIHTITIPKKAEMTKNMHLKLRYMFKECRTAVEEWRGEYPAALLEAAIMAHRDRHPAAITAHRGEHEKAIRRQFDHDWDRRDEKVTLLQLARDRAIFAIRKGYSTEAVFELRTALNTPNVLSRGLAYVAYRQVG